MNPPRHSDTRIGRWMAGFGFPTFSLSLLFTFTLLSGLVLLIPDGSSALSRFAEEFRIWCFGYDPDTGRMQTVWVVLLFVNPAILAAFLWLVWGREIRRAWGEQRQGVIRAAIWGAVAVALFSVGFAFFDLPEADDGYEFPAEELRTAYVVPEFSFEDQHGQQVTNTTFAGDVVILTSIYSVCPTACPLILQQAKRVLEAVDPEIRGDIRVVGITMDPERDTRDSLRSMAERQGVDGDVFRLLSGPPEPIFALLDRLGIERRTDPETGLIDHTNAFLLVDRSGRIAYRFTLGEVQEEWLQQALVLLLNEERPASNEQARR